MKFRTHLVLLALFLLAFALPLHTTSSIHPTAGYVSNAFADTRPTAFSALASRFAALTAAQGLNPDRQAACAADANGMLFSYNNDLRIVPASVSKLYLFDFALSKLPTDFRYTTMFVRSGSTLYINGAGDPQMTAAHLRTVLSHIRADGDPAIATVAISPNFYFDMTNDPTAIRAAVARAVPGAQVISTDAPYQVNSTDAEQSYQFESIPLPAFLKTTSNYSNNFFANVLFDELGGSAAFGDYLSRTYGVGPETVQFSTGSGISGNYTTCAQTLRVLEHLDKMLAAKGLSLTDVMTMPEVDPGVLSTRSIDADAVGSLVAKSGYLRSHHNLTGIINSSGGHVYFAAFTDYPPSADGEAVNRMVDSFTNELLSSLKITLEPLHYTPDPSAFTDYRVAAN